MHPILVKLGSFEIHSYGFFTALGFLLAVQVHRRLGKEAGLKQEDVLDLTFWGLIAGFVGARLMFVLTQFSYFMENPLEIPMVWKGGLVFMGAPFALVPYMIWFSHKRGFSPWRALDVMIPGVTLAHAFGRLGCLAAGCCYGKPTGSDWGVRLESELVDVQLRGIPLHPTQLYEFTALLVLFAGLVWVFRRRQFDGQVILTYFTAYPVIRSVIELFRGDQVRGFVIQDVLSTSQFISILFVAGALVALTWRLKQVKKTAAKGSH